MSIFNLPNELLSTILDLSRPNGFENLVLTCKRFHWLARDLLPRHNMLRRKYRHFEFCDSRSEPAGEGYAPTYFVPQLLLDIADDPIIPLYIVHADLGNRQEQWEYRDSVRISDEPITAVLKTIESGESKAKLRKLLQQSDHLRSIDFNVEEWMTRILADNVNAIDELPDCGTAFLLSLLANVETLELPNSWKEDCVHPRDLEIPGHEANSILSDVPKFVQLLIRGANDEKLQDQPLSKLRDLRPTVDVDTQFGVEVLSIAPFLALRSLRGVHHEHGQDEVYQETEGWEDYPVLGPNIEVLKLDNYVLSHQLANKFFKDMKQLRKLHFEYVMKDEIGYDWSAEEFTESIMKAVGDRLESFTFKIGYLWQNEYPVKSLRDFDALQHLNVDTQLFYKWGTEDDDEDDDGDDSDDEDSDNGDDGKDKEEIKPNNRKRSILEMLPDSLPSLKTFSIFCETTEKDCARLKTLLTGFGTGSKSRLPNLSRATVSTIRHTYAPQSSQIECEALIRELCEAEGMQLKVRADTGELVS